MVYEAESGQRMWLMKAIREGAGELFNQFTDVSERGLRWRPAEGEWCLKEVAAHIRDAELLYQKQIDAIAQEHEPRLAHEALDVLPTERDYLSQDVYRLLNEYAHARQETVWTLRMLDDEEWLLQGRHPYRGLISINDIVREMHEHDLEHLYQARRLHDAAGRR